MKFCRCGCGLPVDESRGSASTKHKARKFVVKEQGKRHAVSVVNYRPGHNTRKTGGYGRSPSWAGYDAAY